MDRETADFLRDKCREISMKANNVGSDTPEFGALIDAAAGIQDVLERHGEWKPSEGNGSTGMKP